MKNEEKEIRESLEKIMEPLYVAHMEFTKKMLDAISDSFQKGIDIGKSLEK